MKKAKRLELSETALKDHLKRFEHHVQHGFLVGSELTIADLSLSTFVQSLQLGVFDYIPAEYVNQFPALLAHKAKVEGLPKIKQYYAARAATTA